ncbi:MAG: response regulator [Bacteroidales bacterium]|nr:response regulator [Bacteroidales bacterium]
MPQAKEEQSIELDDNQAEQKQLILFVDDNKDIITYAQSCLAPVYRVITGFNGKEALDKALKHVPDLIITDVMMPEMDGIEFTRKIKTSEITRHIPVIILSARTATESQQEGFVEGATDYITKPFSMSLLELKIKNILADRSIIQSKYKKRAFVSIDRNNLRLGGR